MILGFYFPESLTFPEEEKDMFKTLNILIALVVVMMASAVAFGADPISETVMNGCKAELDAYCKDVTPGDGRILACLYANSDKLTGKCGFALYDAAAQLEWAVAGLAYAVSECEDDLDAYCAEVPVGEGGLLECLEDNEKKVSNGCLNALKVTGLK
jgi:hypothetical protein